MSLSSLTSDRAELNRRQATSLFSKPPVWIEDLGFTTLYEPENNDAAADLVFVHGLQGNPRTTWTFSGSTTERVLSTNSNERKGGFFGMRKSSPRWTEKTVKKSVYWPADLLPNEVQSARILTYGYDSHITKFFQGAANQTNISDHGRSFLNDLSSQRRSCRGRPIIFVAHSLGGLIVKEALHRARDDKYHSHLQEIYTSSYAIIFFGTPHSGSPDAAWGEILRRIAAIAQFDTARPIIADLNPWSGSSKLDELAEAFSIICEERSLKIYSFQESKGKAGTQLLRNLVVPKESSAIGDPKHEIRDAINANYMDMCRFSGNNDSGYKKVISALNLILDALKDGVDRGSDDPRERLERWSSAVLDSLRYENMDTRTTQVVHANDQSLDWIWSTSPGRPGMVDWLSRGNEIFWISGKPGSGKSTLMKYLTGHDKTRNYLHQRNAQKWTLAAFFFDFRAGTGIANNLDGMMRSVLAQMIGQIPELASYVPFDEDKDLAIRKPQYMDAGRMQEVISSACRSLSPNVCAFIDGLDEYEGNVLDLLSLLKTMTEDFKFKVCLASRPEPAIKQHLEKFEGMKMQEHNAKSIELYVTERIRLVQADQNDQLVSDLARTIVGSAEGVILWARLAVDELIMGYIEGENEAELHFRLLDLPKAIEDLYQRIIDRIEPRHRMDALIILQLVGRAIRPPQLDELQSALAIISSEVGLNLIWKEPLGSDLAARRIHARVRGLVDMVPLPDGTGFSVRPIHQTLRTYLDRQNWLKNAEDEAFKSIYPDNIWLRVCTQSLASPISKVSLNNLRQARPLIRNPSTHDYEFYNEKKECVLEERPVLRYSTQHVFDHARECEATGKSSYDIVSAALCSPLILLHFGNDWNRCSCVNVWNPAGFESDSASLFWGTFHNLYLYCCDAIRNGQVFGIDGGQALLAAISSFSTQGGSEQTQKLLSLVLDRGVRITDYHIFQAIQNLIPERFLHQMLQKKDYTPGKGLQVHLEGEERNVGLLWAWATATSSHTPEHYAALLDFMIGFGEDVNDFCSRSGTVLHAVVKQFSSYEDLCTLKVQMLISRGIGIDIGLPNRTPLEYAHKEFRDGRHKTRRILDLLQSPEAAIKKPRHVVRGQRAVKTVAEMVEMEGSQPENIAMVPQCSCKARSPGWLCVKCSVTKLSTRQLCSQ